VSAISSSLFSTDTLWALGLADLHGNSWELERLVRGGGGGGVVFDSEAFELSPPEQLLLLVVTVEADEECFILTSMDLLRLRARSLTRDI